MKTILTVEETKKYFDISKWTLDQWRANGLKHFKVGRKVYFDLEDIKEFLNEYMVYERS